MHTIFHIHNGRKKTYLMQNKTRLSFLFIIIDLNLNNQLIIIIIYFYRALSTASQSALHNKSAKWHCGRHTLICKKNSN